MLLRTYLGIKKRARPGRKWDQKRQFGRVQKTYSASTEETRKKGRKRVVIFCEKYILQNLWLYFWYILHTFLLLIIIIIVLGFYIQILGVAFDRTILVLHLYLYSLVF